MKSNTSKPKSAKKNYFYNLAYQLVALLTPLVVTPYISRVLGSSGIGQYAFTYSIVTYFTLLGSLGFGYYAQREIAMYQGDKEKQSKIFFEILIARFLSVLVSLLIHIVIILTGVYGDTYSTLMWIMTINIVAIAFDVTFLFQGNEDFGIIAIRNIVIKIIGVVLILVFVKDETHVWLYALCQALILIVSNLSLWTRIPKVITRVKAKDLEIKRHFVPTLRLFIPTVAVSVYTMLDKTLIGVLVPGTTVVDGVEKNISDIENGFYDNAEKMVKMAMTIVTSLGTIMIPKNSFAIASGDEEGFKNNISNALRFVFFLGLPITFGIASIAFNFSPWFFGPGFEKVPYLMVIMSPLVVIIGLSSVLGLQYLLPKKQDKKYTIAICSGALINLLLNLILIHFLWSYGAAIATIAAEIIVTTLMLFLAKKDISVIEILKVSWKYFLSGALMFGAVFGTQYFLQSSILNTMLLIIEGVVVYFAILFILRDHWFVSQVKSIVSILVKRKKSN